MANLGIQVMAPVLGDGVNTISTNKTGQVNRYVCMLLETWDPATEPCTLLALEPCVYQVRATKSPCRGKLKGYTTK